MEIELHGLGETLMFLKNNDNIVNHENFPKKLKDLKILAESLKRGCKCHHARKIQGIKASFQNMTIEGDDKQNLKTLFPEGFKIMREDNTILVEV